MADSFVKLYLVLYNVLLFLGWVGVFVGLVFSGTKSKWDLTRLQVTEEEHLVVLYLELFALLEVFNALAGLVRGSAFAAFLLHLGRLVVLNFGVPHGQRQWVIAGLYFVFALGEIIRYPMYLLQVLGIEPHGALVWLRYTATLCLLPFGFLCEIWLLLDASNTVKDTSKGSNLYEGVPKLYLYYGYMAFAYLYGAPTLLKQMYSARRKKLAPKRKAD